MSDEFNPYHKWLGIPFSDQSADQMNAIAKRKRGKPFFRTWISSALVLSCLLLFLTGQLAASDLLVIDVARCSKPQTEREEEDEPRVPEPSVPGPKVPEPSVPEPEVPEPSIPEPEVPEPSVPQPEVPAPGVPEPETPEPGTPEGTKHR